MTGESEPVRKQAQPADDDADGPEQPGCLYRGTQVVDGVGQMLVTEVGDATYLGQIARRLSADEDEEEAEAAADTQEKRGQAQADDLQGTDAAAGEADRPGRPDQQGRLHRGGR